MILKSIQSQFKTIQPQLKKKKGKTKIQVSPKKLFLIANASSNLQLQMQGPARGYPLWTCFWQSLFKRILKKKAAVLEKVKFLSLQRLALFMLLKSSQSQFKTIQPQLKKGRKEKQKYR